MAKSIFDLRSQQTDVSSKIVAGLERISEVFRTLLWEHAKVLGLSPIQIQILIFIAYHSKDFCNVSHLAQEFNLSKATISDAVKALVQKKLIEKHPSELDKRAYSIVLNSKGKAIVKETESFANPIKLALEKINTKEQEQFFTQLTQVIYSLNQKGILKVQRTCYACKFYQKKKKNHFCHLLNQELLAKDIRIDCPEFEIKYDKNKINS